MLTRISLIAISILSLPGCTTAPTKDTASPAYLPPVGSQLHLKRAISLDPGQELAYIQNGAITTAKDYDYTHPNCQLWVRQATTPSRIEPDQFDVTRVYRDWNNYGELAPPIFTTGAGMSDARPTSFLHSDRLLDHYVAMELQSSKQPWAWRLICNSGWSEVQWSDSPSINQMRAALGELAELRLAE